MWDQNVIEAQPPERIPARIYDSVEDIDDGRCKASTYQQYGRPPKKFSYEHFFGPGGFNRCVGNEGHVNPLHKDEWGHVFKIKENGRPKVVRREGPDDPIQPVNA